MVTGRTRARAAVVCCFLLPIGIEVAPPRSIFVICVTDFCKMDFQISVGARSGRPSATSEPREGGVRRQRQRNAEVGCSGALSPTQVRPSTSPLASANHRRHRRAPRRRPQRARTPLGVAAPRVDAAVSRSDRACRWQQNFEPRSA